MLEGKTQCEIPCCGGSLGVPTIYNTTLGAIYSLGNFRPFSRSRYSLSFRDRVLINFATVGWARDLLAFSTQSLLYGRSKGNLSMSGGLIIISRKNRFWHFDHTSWKIDFLSFKCFFGRISSGCQANPQSDVIILWIFHAHVVFYVGYENCFHVLL